MTKDSKPVLTTEVPAADKSHRKKLKISKKKKTSKKDEKVIIVTKHRDFSNDLSGIDILN